MTRTTTDLGTGLLGYFPGRLPIGCQQLQILCTKWYNSFQIPTVLFMILDWWRGPTLTVFLGYKFALQVCATDSLAPATREEAPHS